MTLLWSLYPLLFSQARGIIFLMILTVASRVRLGDWDAASGSMEWRPGPVQSNLNAGDYRPTPNVWLGLSADHFLALLDGSQRFAFKHCYVEPGVLTAWLTVFMHRRTLLAAGIALVLLVVNLSPKVDGFGRGVLTIVGRVCLLACLPCCCSIPVAGQSGNNTLLPIMDAHACMHHVA
jgi:hypothetical protein